MGFDDYKNSLVRKPIWLVALKLDQCANQFGVDCAYHPPLSQEQADDYYVIAKPGALGLSHIGNYFNLRVRSRIDKIKVKCRGLTSGEVKMGARLFADSYWDPPPGGLPPQTIPYIKKVKETFSVNADEDIWLEFNFEGLVINPGTYWFDIYIDIDSSVETLGVYYSTSDTYPYGYLAYKDADAWHDKTDQDLCFVIEGDLAQNACYYSYPTCVDRERYQRGTYTWKFTSRDSIVGSSLPLVERVTYIPIEIDPKYNISRRGEMIIELLDDSPLYYAIPGKESSPTEPVESEGSFWRNFLARNPNYYHRLCEVYLGFEGLAEADFKLFFRGVIEKIELKKDRIVISCKDLLQNLTAHSHPKQGDDCKLAQDYTGGTAVYVYNGNELLDWGIIKTEDGAYIKYNGKSGPDSNGVWTLANASYCFGSFGTVPSGKKIKQVLVYARDNYGIGEGFPVDWILLDLLCNRAGISAEYIEMVDSGETLTADITASDSLIPVSNVNAFPDLGVIKVDDELIIYQGKSGASLDIYSGDYSPLFHYHYRGAFGTTASPHSQGAKVYLPKITVEADCWLKGARFRAEIVEPKKTQELVNQLCQQALVQLWQNENSLVDFRAIAPPRPSQSVAYLNDVENIVEESFCYKNDPELQASRVIVYYKPLSSDAGKNPEKYQSAFVMIEEDIENENWLGEPKPKIFYANWIYRSTEASTLAGRYLLNYKQGARKLAFQVELKELDLKVGDLFWVQHKLLIAPDGKTKEKLLCQVLKKQFRSPGRIEINALESKLTAKYGYIAPQNPTLYEDISETDTTIELQLSGASFQNDDFAESGVVKIDNEYIIYSGKNYSSSSLVLTLTGCTRGALDSTAKAHSAGTEVFFLYGSASEKAKESYCWIGDSDNLLDSDKDGEGDEEGYYIF